MCGRPLSYNQINYPLTYLQNLANAWRKEKAQQVREPQGTAECQEQAETEHCQEVHRALRTMRGRRIPID